MARAAVRPRLPCAACRCCLRCSSPAARPRARPQSRSSSTRDQDRIEITRARRVLRGRGDSLQVETAPAADGMTGRISVTANDARHQSRTGSCSRSPIRPTSRSSAGSRPTATTSSARASVWPDLDARRIEAVTPSVGYVPERIKSDRADMFRITLEPGQTVTYVAELASDRFARIYLWKPIEYEQKSRDRQLFNGIMLGITGLLAIFLTAVFAANHKAIFPTAALFTWCVLAYLCVDFGFWHKLFSMRPEENARLPRGRRGRHGGEPAHVPVRVPAAGRLARLRAHAARGCGWRRSCRWSRWRSSIRVWPPRSPACRAWPSPAVGAGAHAVPGAARAGPCAVAGADVDAAAGVAVRRRR